MKKILIVDDDPCARLALKMMLTRIFGHEVKTASGKDEAETILKSWGKLPDILITDINMPNGTEGLSLVEFARTKYPSVKCALMSGQDYADKAEALGVKFLDKPISREKLEGVLNVA